MKSNVDRLIENAKSLSPFEEAEKTRLAIQQGGISALVPSNAQETQVETNEKAAAVMSVDDVWKPFAIEWDTEPTEKAAEKAPKTLLGRLSRWYSGKNPGSKPAAEAVSPQKKRTVKRLIRDGFFQLFLFILRWMVQRTVKNIKKYL